MGMTARSITTRRIAFDYPQGSVPQHFAGGDLVMSHVVAMLSAMFPNGEDFFVESVRRYRERIEDPELKRQVGRFIGQEAIHGGEHRVLNQRLQEMGYCTRFVDRAVEIGMNRVAARVLPHSVQLAITAALEHYTATLAEVLLSDEEARGQLDGEIANLLLWHALEESEHKAVAFDVYRTVVGNGLRGHLIRTLTMDVVTVLFLLAIVDSSRRSMRRDPAARDRKRRRESLRRVRSSVWLSPAVRARIGDYNRRDFHPDDNDTDALLAEWREALFGPGGRLAGRLADRPGRSAAA
jgi:predicted metal-dependent hydrolase